MHSDSLKIAGVLYVIAVFQFFVFELVAETLYPGYSVSNNYISDLGATCIAPPSTASCVVHQPSATIFDTSVFFLGVMLFIGAFFVYRGTRKKPYFFVTAVADIAILLVGVFPENTGWVHAIDSWILFILTGISLILVWSIVKTSIFRFLAVAFGVLTIYFTIFGGASAVVGVGGEERLIVLPALLGILAFGGYLTGLDSTIPIAKQKAGAPEDV